MHICVMNIVLQKGVVHIVTDVYGAQTNEHGYITSLNTDNGPNYRRYIF